jgi:LacI family transcriptional regulator, galactose operon repressor
MAKVTNIHEVARLSGVSVATVSRVFNGYKDVSEATRKRVLESAKQLDYTPSGAARTLVRKRSELIGVFLFTGIDHPDIQHPFFQDVLVALKQEVGAAGFDVLLFATEREEAGLAPHSFLTRARHHHVDGLVLMGIDAHDPELKRLVDSKIPTIAIDLELVGERAGFVMSENQEGARLAVRHLWELGHRRIATIAGDTGTKPGLDRLVGFRTELESLGGEAPDAYVEQGDFYTDSGYAAMQRLLDRPEPPTAVFAASDLMAVGAIKAVEDAGLRCPEDVAVVGFDDIQIAELLNPALTTIRQDKRGLGTAAGRSLISLVEEPGAAPPVRLLPVELVVRRSCGAAKAAQRPRRGAAGARREVA